MVQGTGMKRRPRTKYSSEVLHKALEDIQEGKLSLRMAAQVYRIPRSTLYDKVNLLTPVDARPGPKHTLSPQEEEQLVEQILEATASGKTFTVSDLKLAIKAILDQDKRANRLRNNCPGKTFLHRFLERHPEIGKVKGTSELVPSTSATCATTLRTVVKKKQSFSAAEKALALKVIESMMRPITLSTYKNVYLSGVNLPTDEFYNVWKFLREDSNDKSLPSGSSSPLVGGRQWRSSQDALERDAMHSESIQPNPRPEVKPARRKRKGGDRKREGGGHRRGQSEKRRRKMAEEKKNEIAGELQEESSENVIEEIIENDDLVEVMMPGIQEDLLS